MVKGKFGKTSKSLKVLLIVYKIFFCFLCFYQQLNLSKTVMSRPEVSLPF